MLGAEYSVQTVPLGGPVQQQLSRPQPEQRVVEDLAKATLQQHETVSTHGQTSSAVARLVASARQFAEILDTTGDVQVASYISGFHPGHLDMYA